MKTLRLLLIASFVAVLTGCPGPSGSGAGGGNGGSAGSGTGGAGGNGGSGGSGAANGGGDAGPPIMLNQACQKLAEATCDRQIACGRTQTSERAVCIALSIDNCDLQRDVGAGNSTFNGQAAAHCIADTLALDCFDTATPRSCLDAVVEGRGMMGAGCIGSYQCAADAGLYCPIFSGTECFGCTRFAGANAFCAGDRDIRCDPSLNCDELFNDDGGHCVGPGTVGQKCDDFFLPCIEDGGFYCRFATDGGDDRCEATLGIGQGPCTFGACAPNTVCASTPTDGGIRRCEALRGLDQPCLDATDCISGLFCPTSTNKCTALLVDGSPCDDDFDCAAQWCNRFPMSGVDAGARSCGYLNANEECWEEPDCGGTRYCRGLVPPGVPDAGAMAGSCTATDPDGGACTNSGTRNADSCSNTAATCLSGVCVVTPPFSRRLGETCDNRRQCGNFTHCDFADGYTWEGHCVAAKNDGEDCATRTPSDVAECKKGSYCDNFGSDQCVKYAANGEACDLSQGPDCSGILNCEVTDGGSTFCNPYVTTGATCSNADGPSCYSSYCAEDGGLTGTCSVRQTNGATCNDSTECSSRRCSNPDGGFDDYTCRMACF